MPNINDYEKILQCLLSLQTNLDEDRMIQLFGPRMGEHLFEKLVRMDRNIIYFYSGLDKYNRLVFIKHLSKM